MTEQEKPRFVSGEQIECCGTAEAPHEPQRLALPGNQEVTCPICGRPYRRTLGWNTKHPASWPKPG